MKKIFVIGFAIGLASMAMVSCNMDFYRSDALTAEELAKDPNAPLYTTNGIYTLFQDRIAYKGQEGGESGNYYIRHYFQLAELRGDNVTVSGITEDPFINPYRYTDDNTAKNIYYSWWMAYKIINVANSDMDILEKAEKTDMNNHLMGENYFFRALGHFHMVTLYAMPYVQGRDNMGVPLRLSTVPEGPTTRATVGEVYDAIVADLIAAKEYMAKDKDGSFIRGTDKGYVSWQAATALLARVYLYMGEDQKCLDECNELMANPSTSLSGYDYAIDLFRRYPADKRFQAYFRMVDPTPTKAEQDAGEKTLKNWDEMEARMNGNLTVVYPIAAGNGEYCTGTSAIGCKFEADGTVKFQSQGEKIGTTVDGMGKEIPVFKYYDHVAKPKMVNGVKIYYVDKSDDKFPGKEIDGVKRVWVRPGPAHPKPKNKTNPDTGEKYPETQADADARYKAAIGRTDNGGFYMRYYNTKFSYQDGMAMMTSPVFLRWGEVVLNRAEAEAKLGQDAKALEDVNIIRTRAGIPALTSGDVSSLGYKNMLELVLDERRMELCFEGHRFFDVFRNNLPMDRRYVGYHTWEIIQPNDPRIALLISQDEINSAGIPQNPR